MKAKKIAFLLIEQSRAKKIFFLNLPPAISKEFNLTWTNSFAKQLIISILN